MEKARQCLTYYLYSNFNTDYEIAYINGQTLTPSGDEYIRETFIPAGDSNFTLGQGGELELVGIYQLDVFVKKGSGAGAHEAIITALKQVFFTGAYLTYAGQRVRLDSAEQAGAYQDADGWLQAVFSIQFTTYDVKGV